MLKTRQRQHKITDKEKEFMCNNSYKKTVYELAQIMGRHPNTIRKFLNKNSLNYKRINAKKTYNNITFTKRELEVFELIAKGYSNKEIAEKLVVSFSAITSFVPSLYSKIKDTMGACDIGMTRIKAMLWYFKYVKNVDLERL